MKYCQTIQLLLLAIAAMSIFSVPLVKVRAASSEIILIRINSPIDYKISDLVASAVTDIQRGNAARLLLEIDTDSGYYAPSMQLVAELSSIRASVIAYVGPSGATSASFSVFLAMASGLLAMNVGSTIGRAAADVADSSSVNYLASVMQSLAVMNGRNAPAAAAMVTSGSMYSADTAYSKAVCDMLVDSYGTFLSAVGLDPASIVERKPSQYPSTNSDAANQVVKFFADPFVLKSMFIALGCLVMVNLAITVTRPRRSKLDEASRAIFELIRMEVLSPEVYHPIAEAHLNETPLHTPQNTPSPPSFKMSRVPTHPPDRRVEKPIEVRKR